MGRRATAVPTAQNVGTAIKRLKPEKRRDWRRLAKAQGWKFEEYVIARIRRNIEYRARQSTATSGGTGATPDEPAVDAEDSFDAFSTQQIEDELSRRKRRRWESWADSRTKKPSSTDEAAELPPERPADTFHDIPPLAPTHTRSPLGRNDSFLGFPPQPTQEASPSGGAASRADTSFARTTSFVTATEGDDDVTSIASCDLPSPISPFRDDSPPAEESLNGGLDTQDWRDFLDSTQGRAMDDPEHFVTPPTHRRSSTPARQAHFPRPPPAAAVVPSMPPPPPPPNFHIIAWNLMPAVIPKDATRLWCVRKGLVPGFHFQEPWMPPLSQSRAFHEMRFETFDVKLEGVAGLIIKANRYMNHLPHQCMPAYAMCYEDCMRRAQIKPERRAHPRDVKSLVSTKKEVARGGKVRCRACDRLLDREQALLCDDCAFGPHPDSDIGFCIRMFDLAEEQTNVIREVAQGHNVFFTGAAGTGKSTTLRSLVRYLHRKGRNVEVVSPTGIAALNVGGRTLHSFAGWTTKADKLSLETLGRIACGNKNYKRLNEPDVLIIDEISMISNFTLSRLDFIMRKARHSDEPFGGVQVVMTGDLLQLPPVR